MPNRRYAFTSGGDPQGPPFSRREEETAERDCNERLAGPIHGWINSVFPGGPSRTSSQALQSFAVGVPSSFACVRRQLVCNVLGLRV